MIKINPKKFKEAKSENGVIAILTIKNSETLLNETRSKRVVYNVQIENKIFGKIEGLETIWNYGNSLLKEGKKYLVFLGRGNRLMEASDFQLLKCEDCSVIIDACEKELIKY